ncbi:DNA polymerase III subunit gamma/tau [Candidatus Saccharibacteria bacterium]|nr:DNA polymerase III subunit gamma/tau [Candidatus Saccharibacteria bacterium]
MKALYRKYRPTKLAEVIGQPQVTNSLEKSLKSDKISHAYLFIGPRGCGKTSVARIFAHEINNFKYEIEDSYIDIIEIDAASNTSVENIRELKERAIIAPTEGKYKVYIIDEIHMLSKSAFNALLKLLEEPPKHVVFIMATTDAHKVLPTIISRSQVYHFKLADEETLLPFLTDLAKKEKIKIDSEALKIIIQRGGGSFRDTISLLDQISGLKAGNASEKITADDIIAALGLPKDQAISDLLTVYEAGDLAAISEKLHDLLNSGTRAETIAEEIISQILKNPSPIKINLLKTLPEVSAPFAEAKLLLAFTKDLAALPTPTAPVAPTVPTPTVAPTAPASAAPTPAPTAPASAATNFSWEDYLEKLENAPVVHSRLKTCVHELDGSTLKIYPEKAIYARVLKSGNNLDLLKRNLPANLNLEILNPEDIPNNLKDSTITKLSDIMGTGIQEVKNGERADDPF